MFKVCFRTHRIQKIGLKINFFFRVLWLEQRWSNFGRRKKVTNFSKNCSLRTFKYKHAAITKRIPSIEQEKSQNLQFSKISKTNGSSSWKFVFFFKFGIENNFLGVSGFYSFINKKNIQNIIVR